MPPDDTIVYLIGWIESPVGVRHDLHATLNKKVAEKLVEHLNNNPDPEKNYIITDEIPVTTMSHVHLAKFHS